MEHEAFGLTARYQRYTAEMLFMIASGRKLDPDRSTTFREIVEKIYRNPFEKKRPQPQTAEEIKAYVCAMALEVINGSAQACSTDHAG